MPNLSPSAARGPAAAPGAVREFLAFNLGHEEYGVDILNVQEIRVYETVTAIANAPPWMKGVINLRGLVVPVVDLRVKLRLAEAAYGPFTVMIVLNIAGRVVGTVVDGVSDVVALRPEEVCPAPELAARLDTRYVLGVGASGGRMIILADIERLVFGGDAPWFGGIDADPD